MSRSDVELRTIPSLVLLLCCCILPQPDPECPRGTYIGCFPRLVASNTVPPKRHRRHHDLPPRYFPSKSYSHHKFSANGPVSYPPPSTNFHHRPAHMRRQRSSAKDVNVVEVTPDGQYIAHANPSKNANGVSREYKNYIAESEISSSSSSSSSTSASGSSHHR